MFGAGRKELHEFSALGDAARGETARRDVGSWREGVAKMAPGGCPKWSKGCPMAPVGDGVDDGVVGNCVGDVSGGVAGVWMSAL